MAAERSDEAPPRLIMVTGMGRSGTSLATAILAQAGARLSADLLEDAESNPEGMNEDSFIVARNKAIVQLLSDSDIGGFDGSAEALVPLLADLRGYVAAQTARPGFAVKDPRFAILLPLWRRLLLNLRIRPRLVFCHRDLASTAASMARAYHMNPQRAADIWLHRAFVFLAAVRRPFLAIGYDDWARDGIDTLTGLRRFARLPGDDAPAELLQRAGLHDARPREDGEIEAALRAQLPEEIWRFVAAVGTLHGRVGATEANALAVAHPAVRTYLHERARDYRGPFAVRPDFWESVATERIDRLVRKARKSVSNQAAAGALPSA